MPRRLLPLLLVLAAIVVACSSPAPALTDPKEIISRGLEATANLKSFHLELTVDGTLKDPSSGSTFPLSGTSIAGDVDLAARKLAATFAVMGFKGEARFLDNMSYVKTGLTGPKWMRSEVAPAASGGPAAALDDLKGSIVKLRAFLERDGVTSRLLDEATCNDRPCYHVKLTLSPAFLDAAGLGTPQSSMKPSALLPEGLPLDLFFDREKLYLSRVTMNISGSAVGDLNAALSLTKVDEPVTVEAPPSDQVTEGGGGLTLP